ncbi:MAG: hypothetical protein R2794_03565 [Chitinophagales bacterium]
MKKIFVIACLLTARPAYTQTAGFDIFLTPFSFTDAGGYFIGDITNITHHPGYDNQPAFTADGKYILYSAQADSLQMDIFSYELTSGETRQITHTTESEFSPVPTEDGNHFTSVLIEMDSTQRMWTYTLDGSARQLTMDKVDSIGYYCFLGNGTFACFMVTDVPTLIVTDVWRQRTDLIDTSVGRCIKRIPGENAFSYIVKLDDEHWQLKKYNMSKGSKSVICDFPNVGEDYVWTPDGKLLTARRNQLFLYDYSGDGSWKRIGAFFEDPNRNVYRLALSPDGTLLAFVADE